VTFCVAARAAGRAGAAAGSAATTFVTTLQTGKRISIMKPQLFTNVGIFDGTGDDIYPGEGAGRKATASRGRARQTQADRRATAARSSTGGGGTLMPGLTEAHAHITYNNFVRLKELGEIPPEEHVLITMENAKLLLDCGFTSLYSAASAKPRTEVVVRNAINAGRIPGPASRQRRPRSWPPVAWATSASCTCTTRASRSSPTAPTRSAARCGTLIREGVDSIKINISGDNFVRKHFSRRVSYTARGSGRRCLRSA